MNTQDTEHIIKAPIESDILSPITESNENNDNIPLTDEEVIVSYLSNEKVRKNLIEVLLYYKGILKSSNWFLLDKLVVKKTPYSPAEIKLHLRLLCMMGFVYTKLDNKNRQVYKITETIEIRKHTIEQELEYHEQKVIQLKNELLKLEIPVKS